ncbi:beta-lactamase-like protein [Vararia minispora EC-137]|uniref:Beta-lactamase-like protein n=1 Tax=Vararia minispora EC-137 TaxID=1314806 RepID=A0ACB8QCQ6_9AGAM|nr:beta-lactamase-like protein [Vararia minispora EC-137]
MSSPADLKRVTKLSITFLVDNSIEWMTKLPPGFVHEVPQFLRNHTPPPDPRTGVPALDFENFCCGAHGLSVLIETEDPDTGVLHRTLFDAGPDSRSITRNLVALAVDPASVSRAVLSHWHSDHSGGLLSFLRARSFSSAAAAPPCVVDVHPDRPLARGIKPPQLGRVLCRLPADPTLDELTQAGATVEMHAAPHGVAGGTVWVSGEIPRVTPFEEGLIGGVRWREGGGWVDEPNLMDERYVAVDVAGKGLVIFSACSHAGIVNVVKDAVRTFKRPVHMVVGGLHLAGPELAPRIAPTVAFLVRGLVPAPTYVLPMHCSGFAAKCALAEALGDGCVPAGTGIKVVVETREGERALDARLIGSFEGM